MEINSDTLKSLKRSDPRYKYLPLHRLPESVFTSTPAPSPWKAPSWFEALQPLAHLVFVNGSCVAESLPIGVTHTADTLSLAPHAHLTLITVYLGDTPSLTQTQLHFDLKAHSTLRHIVIDGQGSNAVWNHMARYTLATGALCRNNWVLHGGTMKRVEIINTLSGEGATLHSDITLLGTSHDFVECLSHTTHAASHCVSQERVHVALQAAAESAVTGRILIPENISSAEAHFTHRALLLDATCRANARPELEIYSEDVQCSHGSSTSTFEPAQLFFLLSRGLDEKSARRILQEAHIAATLPTDLPQELQRAFWGEAHV